MLNLARVSETQRQHDGLKAYNMNLQKKILSRFVPLGAAFQSAIALALLATPAIANAATINLSSLETVLENPDPHTNPVINYAACVGWMTEVIEHNTPFIEIANGVADQAISMFKMTIGDTRYQFSNIFSGKEFTNAWNIPANGEYALLGLSTPGIHFTTTIEDGGDTLVVDFGPGGLLPGQTVRFQVDIDMDPGSQGTLMYAAYSSVFFEPNGGSDISGNSVISIFDEGNPLPAITTLPNFSVMNPDPALNPRPHSEMQMLDLDRPDLQLNRDPIPEPSSLILSSLAAALCVTRRWRKAS